MNGATTDYDDDYLATVLPIAPYFGTKTYFISRIETLHDEKLHHIIVNGCSNRLDRLTEVVSTSSAPCSNPQILYAWANDADPLVLPDDAAIRIGGSSNINSIKLECHYKVEFKIGRDKFFSQCGKNLHFGHNRKMQNLIKFVKKTEILN